MKLEYSMVWLQQEKPAAASLSRTELDDLVEDSAFFAEVNT